MTELVSAENILSHLKPELEQKCFVNSIGLFGSVVIRADFTIKSDVEVIVDLTKPVGIEFIDPANRRQSIA